MFATACAFALSACVSNTGQPMPKTTEGSVIGGLIGGIIGSTTGGKKKVKRRNILLGTAIGAAVGGLVGQQLDAQEASLRTSLKNSEVGIVNTGKELVVTLPDGITFDTGSTFVRSDLRGDLAVLAASMNDFPDTTIDVIGHTDNVGEASFNQQLSAERAQSVYNILADGDVAPGRMRAFGRGEEEPKDTNLTEQGREQNRRVEIIIRPIT